ncbi:MAG: hypothetical protein NT061_03380 [Spirochaetes bacterium]|nr:hypothetical protein [Spirochaetota bacterium]
MKRSRLGLILALLAISTASGFAQVQPLSGPEFLIGGLGGLASISLSSAGPVARSLLSGTEVRSIVPVRGGWFILSSEGPLFSPDLASFEPRTAGLPSKTLLIEDGSGFSPIRTAVEIKAFAVDPRQNGRMAVMTSSEIWYSDDWGKSWTSLGNSTPIPGYKALSFGPIPGKTDLGLWVSHSMKGLFAREVDGQGSWTGYSAGLPRIYGGGVEETAGFALFPDEKGSWRFALGMSFLGEIYEWDNAKSVFSERFSDGKSFGYVECLAAKNPESLVGVTSDSVCRFPLEQRNGRWSALPDQDMTADFKAAAAEAQKFLGTTDCAALIVPRGGSVEGFRPVVIDESWRLVPPPRSQQAEKALRKQGLYLQTSFLINPQSRKKYFDLITTLGLDSLVIDMKDDSGKLRFTPRSPLLAAQGAVSEPLDLENFVAEAKKRGIYLIARIVVFKDKTLYSWNSAALAVHDGASGKPWQGLRSDARPIEEYWVDPYSPEVWRYNTEIAGEVIDRGFDEVQFDYIRFPTDGNNVAAAIFPAKAEGMDQDGALESFLRYARSSITAPISIDIYGSNGWYRTGSRTGQDVEMLSKYVDVICPMLYPSHFEQTFLAQEPAELRPYRIYRLGTSRNLAIARDRAIVRPYVQAFYLDVSYDRLYYGLQYVRDEVRGLREGANQGMTFWNNSGRYDDVPSMK